MTDLALSLKRSGLSCWPGIRRWAPCENACPLHMNIPGFVISVAQGQFEDAYAIMRETNPFPGICGYVCHHPCETDCVRGHIDDPINSRGIRRFVVDRKLAQGEIEASSPETFREIVAVIGSGPAGLTCAHDLAKLGYQVTVFEEAPVAGGMLVLGIPEFVLPRHVAEAEIDCIRRMGIEIRTSTSLGKSMTVDDLWHDGFKAILLATGSWHSLELDIPGTEFPQVLQALQFLRDYNQGERLNVGAKVVVIGGGNVGMDVARAALRSGAKEVYLVCLECREEMPAFDREIQRAEEEGIRINPSLGVREILGSDGKVTGLRLLECSAIEYDDSGRILPILSEAGTSSLDADTVIIAIGQSVDPSQIEGIHHVQLSPRGTVAVNADTMATDAPGIFAVGDAVAGAGTVVESIAAGHRAAASIDRYFRGEAATELQRQNDMMEIDDDRLPRFVRRRNRVEMANLPLEERFGSGKNRVVEQGYSEEQAVSEAIRCLSCPVCGNCIYDRYQICYETATRLL